MNIPFSVNELLDLIRQDIKVNRLYFSFVELGFECPFNFPDLSSVVFEICNIPQSEENDTSEKYYQFLNSFKELTDEELTVRLNN